MVLGAADVAPGDRQHLGRTAGGGDLDESRSAHSGVGGVEGDPTRAGQVDFDPRMRSVRSAGAFGINEIARHRVGAEAEASNGGQVQFHKVAA